MEVIINELRTLYPQRFDESIDREIAFFNAEIDKARKQIDVSKDEEIKVKQAEKQTLEGKYMALLDLAGSMDNELLKAKTQATDDQIKATEKEIELLSDWNNQKRLEIANHERMINRFELLRQTKKESYTTEEIYEGIKLIKVFSDHVEINLADLIFHSNVN